MIAAKWMKVSSFAWKAWELELGFERSSGVFHWCLSLMGSACFRRADWGRAAACIGKVRRAQWPAEHPSQSGAFGTALLSPIPASRAFMGPEIEIKEECCLKSREAKDSLIFCWNFMQSPARLRFRHQQRFFVGGSHDSVMPAGARCAYRDCVTGAFC